MGTSRWVGIAVAAALGGTPLRAELTLPAFETGAAFRQALAIVQPHGGGPRYKQVEKRAKLVMESLGASKDRARGADDRAEDLGRYISDFKRLDVYYQKWAPLKKSAEGIREAVSGSIPVVRKELKKGLERAKDHGDYSKIDADLPVAEAQAVDFRAKVEAVEKAVQELDQSFRADVQAALAVVARFKEVPVVKELSQREFIAEVRLEVADPVNFSWGVLVRITKEGVSEPALRDIPKTFENFPVNLRLK